MKGLDATLAGIDALVGRPGAFLWLPQLREHGDASLPNRGIVSELWSGPDLLGLVAGELTSGWVDEAQALPWDDPNADPLGDIARAQGTFFHRFVVRRDPRTDATPPRTLAVHPGARATEFDLAVLRGCHVPVDDIPEDACHAEYDARRCVTVVRWDWTILRGHDGAVLRHNDGSLMRAPGGHVEITDAFVRAFQHYWRADHQDTP